MVTKANDQLHRGIISVTFAITDTRRNFVETKLLYFPQIIARGDYFFFGTKRGRLFEGDVYFKYCSLIFKKKIMSFRSSKLPH